MVFDDDLLDGFNQFPAASEHFPVFMVLRWNSEAGEQTIMQTASLIAVVDYLTVKWDL